ncbi:MAG: NINE protein [Saprospiraceae bacterium]|nr:NINE protein [Saprospiraceae bacterium]MBP7699528.1 NINE protein [Saprospiraceae bacterium]
MRKKNIAAIFAIVMGVFGLHRFYLGQFGKGMTMCMLACMTMFMGVAEGTLLPILGIIAIIDAIMLFSMPQAEFDRKYNRYSLREVEDDPYRHKNNKYEERKRERRNNFEQGSKYKTDENPYKKSGIEKFKAYNLRGAIDDFKKSLQIDPQDKATHFNIACAYSLNEQADLAFWHLDCAVQFGFRDFDKIKTHDALAFVRIQEEFITFANGGYRLSPEKRNMQGGGSVSTSTDFLEQIKQLGELRDSGVLTEEEFVLQKKKLFG